MGRFGSTSELWDSFQLSECSNKNKQQQQQKQSSKLKISSRLSCFPSAPASPLGGGREGRGEWVGVRVEVSQELKFRFQFKDLGHCSSLSQLFFDF